MVLLLGSLLLGAGEIVAQERLPAPAPGVPAAQAAQTGPASDPGAAVGPLLDAPVSRSQYRIGPGDILTLSIFGSVNRLHNLPVTPDGAVVVPEIGVARVLDLNLDQAQARVGELVRRYYQGIDVNLSLARARVFKVFVVGAVPSPGFRVASSATRVGEVVPDTAAGGVVRRNVLVRRSSGDSVDVDLVRFRQMGDLEANPTVREGDVILVPAVDQTVQVFGRLHFPGIYEYRPGETLADLLSVANGSQSFPVDAADTVRVTRFLDREQREFHAFSRADVMGAPGRAFRLRPSDAVYVARIANFRVQRVASLQGQVNRPGVYPIHPGVTTVRELVEMAGGFTPEASLVDATLRRQIPASEGQAARQLQNVPEELLDEDERRILQTRAQADPSAVVIDFQRLFLQGQRAYDQTLEDRDVLDVPRRRSGVTVLGAVAQPGIVQYAAGQQVGDYVRLAGGFSRRADRGDVTVLKARLGTQRDIRDVDTIDPGDQIIVPFRRRRNPLQTLQTVQGVVAAISGFALTLLALDPYF